MAPRKKKASEEGRSKNGIQGYIAGAGMVQEERITNTLEKNYMPYAMSVILSLSLIHILGGPASKNCGTAGCDTCTASERFSSSRQLPVRLALYAQAPTLYECTTSIPLFKSGCKAACKNGAIFVVFTGTSLFRSNDFR